MADEILEIADGVKADDPIRVAQMRIDVRKWLVSKLAPKKYGDRVRHEGGDDAEYAAWQDFWHHRMTAEERAAALTHLSG